jgi:hypothetical protein
VITDSQLMTLALALVIPLSMLIYSNSRITEAKETLHAEIGQLRSDLTLTMETRFTSIDRKLDELLRLSADHDQRITTLEQRPR